MKMKYSFNSKIEKFFSNKMLLNFIVGISFLNIIAFVMLNQTLALIYFILIGLVTSFFSKNMSIVLLVPLILVNLFVVASKSMYYKREGLENKTDSDKAVSDNKSKSESTTKKTSSSSSSSTNQGLPITPLDHPQDTIQRAANETNAEIDESFEVGRGKKNSKGYNIDYASTVEDAYDELNKILGSDGIKRLTSDTQNLMKQQMKLAESMKDMQPLIAGMAPIMKQAEGLLGSMSENGNLGDLAKIAKKFTAAQ